MISLSEMTKSVEKFTTDNSPVVLTAVGVAGVATTAVLTAKGAFKASEILRLEEADREVAGIEKPMDLIDKTKSTWTCYIPAASSGILTCAAIIGSSQISTRRAAAMAAAYSLSEKKLNEFKTKVAENVGPKRAEAITEEYMREKVEEGQASGREVYIVGNGDQLCYDSFSGRFFKSNIEALKHGMNRVNHAINNDGYASLTDFYDAIGLDKTGVSDELGWRSEQLLDISFTTTMSPDGKPAICMEYRTQPIRDYFRMG